MEDNNNKEDIDRVCEVFKDVKIGYTIQEINDIHNTAWAESEQNLLTRLKLLGFIKSEFIEVTLDELKLFKENKEWIKKK